MKKKIWILSIIAGVLLLSSIITIAAVTNRVPSKVEITNVEETTLEEIQEENPEQEIPITSEQRLDFTVDSPGRMGLSTFNIIVWTTDGREIDLGDFGFQLRETEEFAPHNNVYEERWVYYMVPERWDSSQQLTEKVEFEERSRKAAKGDIGEEPLFKRGEDYPESIPFDEIEIQVDRVIYYKDTEETSYLAWVRILENEEYFDIKKIIIEGHTDEQEK